jgi:DNA polymerase-1
MTTPVVIGWDVETHVIEDGCLTPKLVVATFDGGPETLSLAHDLFSDFSTGARALRSDVPMFGSERCLIVSTSGDWKLALTGETVLAFLVTLINALRDGSVDVLTAQNQTFDWGVVCNKVPELLPAVTALLEQGKLACTMVREMLICIAEDNFVFDQRCRKPTRFNLAYLVNTYFRVDISSGKKAKAGEPEPWRLRYHELDGVPLNEWPEKALDYALEDAVWARLVYLEQAKPQVLAAGPYVLPSGAVVNEVEQTCAAWALHLMACHGVYTDEPMVDKFEEVVRAQAAQANDAAREAGFWKINKCKTCEGTGVVDAAACPICNGHSHKQCVSNGTYKSTATHTPGKNMARLKALVTAGYFGHPPMTDKGAVKTDADTLLGSGHPLLIKYAEGAQAQKLLNTYLPILRMGVHSPITSSPNVLVRSGRTSWRNPNFQNPPQKGGFRNCFIPRPGKVFASIDYSALEMVTLAQVCLHFFGHSKMAEAIREGKDLHTMFAGHMLAAEGMRKPYEEWMVIKEDHDHPLHSLIKERRQQAKAANFGFPGGLGVQAFVEYAKGYGADLTFNKASDLKDLWMSMWPEMSKKTGYFRMLSDASKSLTGRFTVKQLYSNRLRGGCSYTSGANTHFQGLAADGAKAAMWALYKACYLGELPAFMEEEVCHLTGVRMWAFIHDEFLFEGDENTAHLWAPQASRIMVWAMNKYTPDVPNAAPPALMRRWLKKAEPTYNDNGDLVPWEG